MSLSAVGKTLSGRPVNAIDIPSTLNTTRIVKEWWRCTQEDERIMLYVAACVHSLPRAVEIVQDYLMRNSDRQKDSNFIVDLFDDLKKTLAWRYEWHTFPDNHILFSILYAKEIELDSKVQHLIACSVLLNSIETSLAEDETIVPISSLTVLAGCKIKQHRPLQNDTIKIYTDLIQEVVKSTEVKSMEGIPLESFVAEWMRYRWNVATICRKRIRLGEFLGIRADRIRDLSEDAIQNLLNTVITTSRPDLSDFEYLKVNSNHDPTGHLREVDSIEVSKKHPMAVRRGAKGDKHDLLAKIYRGKVLKPLLLYFDQKSPRHGNPDSIDNYETTQYMHQYFEVKKMCNAVGVPFLYCYWTHDLGWFQTFEDEDCFVLREEECKSFFGPMWPIFIECRST